MRKLKSHSIPPINPIKSPLPLSFNVNKTFEFIILSNTSRFPDPHRGYARLSPSVLHPKTNVVAGVLDDECGELVKSFFARKR
jgi:hypothetical protein